MMHCWVVRDDGYALINECGGVVGRIIDLDKQIHARGIKRVRSPSGWFKLHVYKKQEGSESA